ncbi:MAG: carbon-nitrogen hydrolase family protein [Proteobacteria bacterium]|nr:carbon-nitrogen hydrolase family protein [Pseudomonadota bacterium]
MKLAVFQSAGGGLSVQTRLTKLGDALAQTDCDLMICPELYLSGYNVGDAVGQVADTQSAGFLEQAAALAKSSKTALVIGYPEQVDGVVYNSALLLDDAGHPRANHRKLAIPPGFEEGHFTAGNTMTLFDYMGLKCAILICYDAEFPENVRKAAQMGAQLVIVPTALNVNWPVVADKVMPTRAFENGVWLAYANHAGVENGLEYYGHSCIVTPTGGDAARAGQAEEILLVEIDVEAVKIAQNRLPYLKDVTSLFPVL